MQTIYNFDGNRIFIGITQEIADDAGAPTGWTFEAPPQLAEGQFASFRGPDWVVLDSYPVIVDPTPPDPVEPTVI